MEDDYYGAQSQTGGQQESTFGPAPSTDGPSCLPLQSPTPAPVDGQTTPEVPKTCSVRGCTHLVELGLKVKMCGEYRGKHRLYAMTKRARRKEEKAAIIESLGAPMQTEAEPIASGSGGPAPWMIPSASELEENEQFFAADTHTEPMAMSSPPEQLMGSDPIPWHLIDPALFQNSHTTSSELMHALEPVVPTAVPENVAGLVAGPSSLVDDASEVPMDVDDAAIGPQPSAEPRPCSVKGCKLTVPAGSFFKMCEPCRDRYRIYGNTKRAKWKRDRDTVTLQLQTRKDEEDVRRAAAGLLPLAEAPIEEWHAWETSVVDDALKLGQQVLDDPGVPLPVRMCTVSHCRKVLPSWYKYRRCEQHRLQNRHHGQLKLKRLRELKAQTEETNLLKTEGGEGSSSFASQDTLVDIKDEEDAMQGLSPADRGFRRNDHHCTIKGCSNMLSPAVPWKACDPCRERDRKMRRIQRMKEQEGSIGGSSASGSIPPGPNGDEEGDDGEEDEEDYDEESGSEHPQGPNPDQPREASVPSTPSANEIRSILASMGPLVVPPMKPRRNRRPNRTQAEKDLEQIQRDQRAAAKRAEQEERKRIKEVAKLKAREEAVALKAQRDAAKAVEKEKKLAEAAALKEAKAKKVKVTPVVAEPAAPKMATGTVSVDQKERDVEIRRRNEEWLAARRADALALASQVQTLAQTPPQVVLNGQVPFVGLAPAPAPQGSVAVPAPALVWLPAPFSQTTTPVETTIIPKKKRAPRKSAPFVVDDKGSLQDPDVSLPIPPPPPPLPSSAEPVPPLPKEVVVKTKTKAIPSTVTKGNGKARDTLDTLANHDPTTRRKLPSKTPGEVPIQTKPSSSSVTSPSTTTLSPTAVSNANYRQYPQFFSYVPAHCQYPTAANAAASSSKSPIMTAAAAIGVSGTNATAGPSGAVSRTDPKLGTFQPYSYIQYTGAASAPGGTAVYAAYPYVPQQPYYGGPTPPQPTPNMYSYTPIAASGQTYPYVSPLGVAGVAGTASTGAPQFAKYSTYQFYKPPAAEPQSPELSTSAKRKHEGGDDKSVKSSKTSEKAPFRKSSAGSFSTAAPNAPSPPSTDVLPSAAPVASSSKSVFSATPTRSESPKHVEKTQFMNGSSFGVLHLPLSKSTIIRAGEQSRWVDVGVPHGTTRPVGRPRLNKGLTAQPVSPSMAAAIVSCNVSPAPSGATVASPLPTTSSRSVSVDVQTQAPDEPEVTSSNVKDLPAIVKICSGKSCTRALPGIGSFCEKCRSKMKKKQLENKRKFKVEPKKLAVDLVARVSVKEDQVMDGATS